MMPDALPALEHITEFLSDCDAACERAKAAIRRAQEACKEASRLCDEARKETADVR